MVNHLHHRRFFYLVAKVIRYVATVVEVLHGVQDYEHEHERELTFYEPSHMASRNNALHGVA
jgi:hypothetical protein